MAITSANQVLNADSVVNATALIDNVINYLNSALESISTARKFCDESVFCTNEGNPFPADMQKVYDQLNDEITKLNNLKTAIASEAKSIRSRELKELADYQEEQRKAAEAKLAASQSQTAQAVAT